MSLQVFIDGAPIGGLLHASVVTTNYFSADSFFLTFAVGKPAAADLAWWSELTDAYVEISSSDVLSPLSATLITGGIDMLVVDPIMRTVSIEGRDLSARLIDSYLQQDFVNQTASEIVVEIATRHGLEPRVFTTFGTVGRYFGDGYTKLSLGEFSGVRSDWDLLVQLARDANFDVFVQGKVLFFQPITDAAASGILISPADLTAMRVERTLAIEPLARVKVQSWNSQRMASYSATTSNPETSQAAELGTATPQRYLFSGSNLLPAQADVVAERYAMEIARLRTVLHVDMPWDTRVSPRSVMILEGTASAFDGLYQIDCVERRYSSTGGSTQSVRSIPWPLMS